MRKRIVTSAGVLIIILLTLVCVKRWNAWFGNPAEPLYSAISSPGRIQLTFGDSGEYSRNLSWQCSDSLAVSGLAIVKRGEADTMYVRAEGKILRTSGGTTVSYHAKLNNLQAGTYDYCVRTAGKPSDWYGFQVNCPDDTFSFVYLGDIQDTINGFTKNFVHDIQTRNPTADFWVLGGDIIERPHDRYWNEYFQSMDSISQTIPAIAVPGNHEYLKGLTRRLEERFIYTFSGLAGSRYKGHAVSKLNYGNTAIVTLDSNRDFWTLLSQRKWLKETLKDSKDKKWKIVVLHHPIYSIKGRMNNLIVRMMFNSLIKKYQVDLVLQGHEHGYARMINKVKNNELSTPVYLVGQSSPKDYRLYFNDRYDRFGTGKRFYQTISAHGDSLFIKSFTEENNLYDDICIVKNTQEEKVFDRSIDIRQELKFNPQRIRMSEEKRIKYEEDIREYLREH